MSTLSGESMLPAESTASPVSFEVIGHRGAAGHAPENTKASFEAANALGVDAIELDLRLSKDGRAVVLHDETLDRTTNGSGAVGLFDAEHLKALDAGGWYDPAFEGERLLFFEEALEVIAGRVPVVVEIKERQRTQELLDVVSRALHMQPTSVVISSFSQEALHLAKELLPDVPRAWLLSKGRFSVADAIKDAKEMDLTQLCPNAQEVDARWVQQAKDAGYAVRTWGIPTDNPARMVRVMRHIVRSGVDGTTADFPDVMKSVLVVESLS